MITVNELKERRQQKQKEQFEDCMENIYERIIQADDKRCRTLKVHLPDDISVVDVVENLQKAGYRFESFVEYSRKTISIYW